MNLAAKQFPVFEPYDKAAYEIYISGCTRECKGCHTPELSDFEFGEPLSMVNLLTHMEEREPFFDVISILGGDLLCQSEEVSVMMCTLLYAKFPDKDMWLFTGAEYEEIPDWAFGLFDVIKYGKYDEDLKQEGLFPSSTNQKVIYKGVDY